MFSGENVIQGWASWLWESGRIERKCEVDDGEISVALTFYWLINCLARIVVLRRGNRRAPNVPNVVHRYSNGGKLGRNGGKERRGFSVSQIAGTGGDGGRFSAAEAEGKGGT